MQTSILMKFRYPRLAIWIAINIPLVLTKPKVLAAFRKYSEQGQFLAVFSLTGSPLPILDYKIMPGSNGQFNGSKNPHVVYLAKSICDRFESNASDRSDPRMHLLLESTILHEMVHWGDWKDGHDHPLEEGKEFEKEAYGRDITTYW